MKNTIQQTCKACGTTGFGNYCTVCGQSLIIKRLTVKNISNEIFHFLTHFDKGFPYTIKRLTVAPGQMQREYIEGLRAKYQKPFSMFFICATLAALAIYWFDVVLVKFYHIKEISETAFFHQYWVLLQVCLLPVYSLITYLFFLKSEYNFAEVAVLQLYTFSFLFLLLICIHLLKFIWPDFQTRYLELPAVLLYCTITFMNFFYQTPKGIVIVKALVVTCLCFFVASFIQDLLIKIFS